MKPSEMSRAEQDWLLAHREVNAILNASLSKAAAGALLHPCKWKLDSGGVLRQGAEPTEWRCDSCGTAYQERGGGFCTHKFCPAAIRAAVATDAWKAVEAFTAKLEASALREGQEGKVQKPESLGTPRPCETCGGSKLMTFLDGGFQQMPRRLWKPCPTCTGGSR